MRTRINPRLIAPLVACAIAGGAAVVGGACFPSVANPPTIRTGNYVLTSPNFHPLPGTITDSAGRALRVTADTFVVNASSQTYEEHATVAITPAGGTEQPPAPFLVSRRLYSNLGAASYVLPVTLYGGNIKLMVLDASTLQLVMPDRTIWHYEYR